jgi:hypothetical protein
VPANVCVPVFAVILADTSVSTVAIAFLLLEVSLILLGGVPADSDVTFLLESFVGACDLVV